MAERTILVCDVCGESAAGTVGMKIGARNLQKDLCEVHLAELMKGARQPRRGRRVGAVKPAAELPGRRRRRPTKAQGEAKTKRARARRARPRKARASAKAAAS